MKGNTMKHNKKYIFDPKEKCTQAVIFARVSTRDQFDKGASIPAQLERLKEYCQEKELKVLKTYEIPESSTNGERKKFHEMVSFVAEQKHKTAIAVYCIDRLQRGYKEYVELDSLRESGHIELHFYKEALILTKDSNSADISRWDFGILGAKMYVGALRDNVKRAMQYNWKNGQWQGFAPVGYLNIRHEDEKADIIVDPVRAPMVQKLFIEYATGNHTMKSLVDLAHVMGLKSTQKKCTKTLSRVQINAMLKNPFYVGRMRIKEEEIPHKYPPLITEDVFQRVQDILSGRSQISYSSKAWYGEKDFVLRGLIRCAHCGNLMTTERHIKKSGKVYTYLKCNHIDRTCTQKPVSEQELLKQIEDKLFHQLHLTPELKKNIQQAVKDGMKEESKNNAAYKRSLTMERDQLEAKKKKLVIAWLDGQLSKEECDNLSKDFETRLKEIDELCTQLNNYDNDLDRGIEQISNVALNIGEVYKSSIISEKHRILQLLLSNSVVDGKSLYFSITKPFDKLLISKGLNEWWAR